MKPEQKIILYVDDDADDRDLLSEAIQKVNPEIKVVLAENGLVALDYLHMAKVQHMALPCLVVLDLNMPFLDGKETFDRIKEDPELQTVRVIIFSSSEKPNDKALFNGQGIEYFSKPASFSYMNAIASHMVEACC